MFYFLPPDLLFKIWSFNLKLLHYYIILYFFIFVILFQKNKKNFVSLFFYSQNRNINYDILLNYQLFLPIDIGINIPESLPVRVIIKLLERLDYR